jgi:large conductance mechanosensitive channel
MLKEFKEFIMRGNVMELAIAFVIGMAFAKIVTSLVDDILMPPIGMLLGGIDFTSFVIILKQGTDEVAPVTINYGIFIQILIEFLIIALAIFFIIKGLNRLKRKRVDEAEVTTPPAPTAEEQLLSEIRDLLKINKR